MMNLKIIFHFNDRLVTKDSPLIFGKNQFLAPLAPDPCPRTSFSSPGHRLSENCLGAESSNKTVLYARILVQLIPPLCANTAFHVVLCFILAARLTTFF